MIVRAVRRVESHTLLHEDWLWSHGWRWGGWGQKPSQAPGSCLEGWDLWVSPWRDTAWCSEQHRLEGRSPGGCAAPLGPCDVCLRTSWGQQGGGGCAQNLSFSNSSYFWQQIQ